MTAGLGLSPLARIWECLGGWLGLLPLQMPQPKASVSGKTLWQGEGAFPGTASVGAGIGAVPKAGLGLSGKPARTFILEDTEAEEDEERVPEHTEVGTESRGLAGKAGS